MSILQTNLRDYKGNLAGLIPLPPAAGIFYA